jgi:hypothetical protein
MPDQFIFLQFAIRYSSLHSMDHPELQIDDILRYLGEDDNQESAPSLPHLMYQLTQPSPPSTCPTVLNKRMATPFKGQLGSTKLYFNHHTYTKRATRDGSHTWRVRMCFDDRLPMMFNHNIIGAVKQLNPPLS